jgi:CPA1 family monovalent cation:H+ antiporter
VLATVIGATTLGTLLRRSWSDHVLAERIDRTWSGIAFALSAVTFFAIGVVIDLPSLGGMLGPIAVGVVAVVAARALIVYVPFVLFRPRVPVGWAHVLVWSGLRGAIAFAAALALPIAFPRRLDVQEIAFGIVLVTLVVQALLAPALVRAAIPARTRD